MMKVLWIVLLAAAVIAAAWFSLFTVPYQKTRIVVAYPMFDIDRFENAERKLTAVQAARVERLLLAAPLQPSYPTLREAIGAAGHLVFPGYGTHGISRTSVDGTKYFLTCVEIPETTRDRCALFEMRNDSFVLLDDIVVASTVSDFQMIDGRAVYRDGRGAQLTVEQTAVRAR